MASRMTVRLTPKSRDIAASVGSLSPGFSPPCWMRAAMWAAIRDGRCWVRAIGDGSAVMVRLLGLTRMWQVAG